MGVDKEGVPNLVEEGEVIFNDYVYSNRIELDAEAKKKLHFPRKADLTYAEAAKKLEKESSERPNDAISQAGLKVQMEDLAAEQERQKAELEARRAKEAFEALSPEEQVAVMQQLGQQEQIAQDAAMEEAAMAEQGGDSNQEEMLLAQQQAAGAPSPEEQAAIEQQLAQTQANVSALGGEIVRAGDTGNVAHMFKAGGRAAKKTARKYDKDWFLNLAKSLGISDDDMKSFQFSSSDPDANMANFNNIYRAFQRQRALDTYMKGQRQSKINELFGNDKLYKYSDDKSKIYKARINDANREGWISKDYTGALDEAGNLRGFLTQEAYDKLKPEEKEAYRRINEKAGNMMYDFSGNIIRDLYNGDESSILGDYAYDEGFKWNDNDAQAIQYPAAMRHSAASYLRYTPALGGAVGLINNVINSPDYGRAQAIIDYANSTNVPLVSPHYIGNYLTYRPFDVWAEQNRMDAHSRAAARSIMNLSGGNRGTAMAGQIANIYGNQLADSQLLRNAMEYNDSRNERVEGFNKDTNKFNATMDAESQRANQNALLQNQQRNLYATITGNKMMDDIDARRDAAFSANLTNFMQSIGNIGEESYDEDRLRWLEDTGVLKSDYWNRRNVTKYGGRVHKKKGGKC